MEKDIYYSTDVSKSSEDTTKREGFLSSRTGWEREESLMKKMVSALGLARWVGFDRQNGRKGALQRIICNMW